MNEKQLAGIIGTLLTSAIVWLFSTVQNLEKQVAVLIQQTEQLLKEQEITSQKIEVLQQEIFDIILRFGLMQ